MIRYTATPASQTTGGQVYTNALARWLAQQKTAQKQFTTAQEPLREAAQMFQKGGSYQQEVAAAQEPLREAVQMFQKGGSYGAGQRAILEQQTKEAQAQALASQVASGMSSGSLASSTAMRAKSDLAAGLLGVEDTRTEFLNRALQALSGSLSGAASTRTQSLNQALQALSGLQSTQAQTTAATVDPTYNTYMSYLNALANRQAQMAQGVMQANLATKLAEAKQKSANNNSSFATITY
jgi:hypothetical protein